MLTFRRNLLTEKELATYTLHLFLILILILPLMFSYPVQAYQEMKVTVVSPIQGETYKCGQIIAVRVEIEFSRHLNYTELTQITNIMLISHWDAQVIRSLPFLESKTDLNGSQIAVYAAEGSPPTDPVSGEMLKELNRRGFIRLPSSPGDYSVTMQVKATEDYPPYSEEITFRVVEQKSLDPQFILFLIFAGLAVIVLVSVFITKRRKKAVDLAR
jgi:hypothetical protein